MNPKKCNACDEPITYEKRKTSIKYCSISCASSYNQIGKCVSTKTKENIKRGINAYYNSDRFVRKRHYCVVCGSEHSRKAKTCGKVCHSSLLSTLAKSNPKCGGSTKQFIKYNDVILDSSWELIVAKSLDENGIRWNRPTFFRLSDGRRYTPDFYLLDYNIYLDPKAYRVGYGDNIEKIKQFESEFQVNCLVLTKKQLTWNVIHNLIENISQKCY